MVVCVHGVGATSATWRHQVTALAEAGCEVVTWDLRGHGRSTGFEVFSRDAALRDLASVAPDGAVLVGHSLGGYLALAHALRRPGSVAALALLATGPGYRDVAAREEWNAWVRDAIPGPEAGIALQPDSFVIDNLASIDVPVVLAVGERDRRYHPGMRHLERVVRAELVVVPGAGHHLHETAPEVVNGLLLSLCAKV